jgi:hypothetical protein
VKSLLLALIIVANHCSDRTVLLEGVWVNKEDTLSFVKFEKDRFYQLYKGKIIFSGKYIRQTTSCDSTYYKGNKAKLDFINVIDSDCYEITGLSDSILAYRHTGSGRLLVFSKKK